MPEEEKIPLIDHTDNRAVLKFGLRGEDAAQKSLQPRTETRLQILEDHLGLGQNRHASIMNVLARHVLPNPETHRRPIRKHAHLETIGLVLELL